MKKRINKKIFLLPILAIFVIFVCTISVKNNVLNIITSNIIKLFEGNEEELIKQAAQNSGFEDTNLYESVINAYNNELTKRGSISYLGGFDGQVEYGLDSITINNGTVKYYGSDTSVGRYNPGNRVGVVISAPQNLDYETIKNAKIIRSNYYKDGRVESYNQVFYQVEDSKEEDLIKYYQSWPVVTEELSKVTIYIEWTEDNHQTFSINISTNIDLEQSSNETTEIEENKKGSIATFEDFYTTENYVIENDTITFDNFEIPYYEEDLELGRTAGNRVGIKILLPDTYSTDLKNNVIITRYNKDNTSTSKQYTLTEIIDDSSYIGIWALVTEDLINSTIMKIGITWNENDPQQVFTVKLGEHITLSNSQEEIENEESEIIPMNLTEEDSPTTCQFKFGTLTTKDCLTESQLAIIKELNASNLNISDITGIEKLTNLTNLDLSNNNLTSLDLTNNPKLNTINITGNPFTKDITFYEATDIPSQIANIISPVTLPSTFNTNILNNQTNEENKYQVSYGIEEELYNVTYNINYYTYTNEDYLIIDDTIYSINEDFTIEENSSHKIENNKLNIYNEDNYLIKSFNLFKIALSSPKYPNISSLPETLYLGFNTISESDITSNLDITITDTITLKHNNTIIKEINLKRATIDSDVYSLDHPYINTHFAEFAEDKINVTNAYLEYDNSNKELKIYEDDSKNNLLKSIPIITLTIPSSSHIKLIDNYLYLENYSLTEENLLDNIEVTNAELAIENNNITVTYEDSVVISLPIISLTTDLDLSKDYIYTKDIPKLLEHITSSSLIKSAINDNTLNIYLDNEEQTPIYTKNILTISSNEYIITENYIFTGIERLQLDKVNTTQGLDKNIDSTTTSLVITYDDTILDSLPIKNITSEGNVYDLEKDYLFLANEDIDLTNISYDPEINNITYTDNTLTFTYLDEVYKRYPVIKEITNEVTIKDNTIYTKFNESFNINSIKYSNTTSEIITEPTKKLLIKYNNDTLLEYNIIEPTYTIPYQHTNNYIYLKNSQDTSNIAVTNGTMQLKNEILTIKSAIEEIEYSIYYITIRDYDIANSYINTQNNSFNIDNIILSDYDNMTKEIIDDTLTIKIADEVVDEYPILSYHIDNYTIVDNNIYTNLDEFQESTISKTKYITYEIAQNILTIKSNLETSNFTIATYNIQKTSITINNNNYGDKYIYIGTSSYTEDLITVTNGIEEYDHNIIRIKSQDGNKILKTYTLLSLDLTSLGVIGKNIYTDLNSPINISVIKHDGTELELTDQNLIIYYNDNETKIEVDRYNIVSSKIDKFPYEEYQNKDYIYLGKESLNLEDIQLTNADKKIEDNKLIIYSVKGTLKEYDLIRITESPTTTTDNYIYTKKENFAKDSFKVTDNAQVTYDESSNSLTIKYCEETVAVIPILTITNKKYDFTNSYIYTGLEELDRSQISVTNGNTSLSEDKKTLNITYNNEIIDSYPIITITSLPYLLEDNNIYTGFLTPEVNDITLTNGTPKINNNALVITYNKENIKTYPLIPSTITLNNSNYKIDETKLFIYTGDIEFNINEDITLTNITSSLKNNILTLKDKIGNEKNYKIITITKHPDYQNGYILDKNNSFKISDFEISNSPLQEITNDNHYKLSYADIELLNIPIVSINTNLDLTNNYIYTKFNDFNLNSISIINGTKEVKNNELILKYYNVVEKYNLVSINFGNLEVKSDAIIINEKMSYEDFIKNIQCTKSSCQLMQNNETITSGTIANGMSIKVFYDDKEIDNFDIVVDYLEIESAQTDENKSFISGIKAGSTITEIKNNISTSGSITIVDRNGKPVADNSLLATGQKVSINLNGKTITYTVIIKGDVSGDGEIDVYDVGLLYKNVKKKKVLEECYATAGRISKGNEVADVYDVGILYKYIKGKRESLEE